MADNAAFQYLTREIEYGREDTKYTSGLLVLEAEGESVALGAFRLATATAVGACNICHELGHMAKDCPIKPNGQACKVCHQHGHSKPNCPDVECMHCGQKGHIKSNCTSSSVVVCHTCKQPGHVAKRCTQRMRKNKKTGACKSCGGTDHGTANCTKQVCTNCGEHGHLLSDCFKGPQPKNNDAQQDNKREDAAALTPSGSNESKPAVPSKARDEMKQQQGQQVFEPAAMEQVERPKGMLDDEKPQRILTAKFITTVNEHHISSFGFSFDGSYENTKANSGWEHKTASCAFTRDNICDDENNRCIVEAVKVTDNLFTKYASTKDQEIAARQVDLDLSAELVHIRIPLRTVRDGPGQGENGNERPLFGQALFSNLDFGEFEQDIGKARDMLMSTGTIIVHFYTVAALSSLEERIRTVDDSMTAQHAPGGDPLTAWWKDGKINPQKGMEISREERPSGYKIHKKYSFMSSAEYFTIFFHNLVHDLDAIDARQPDLTYLKIARFPGGDDQLYFAHLGIPYESSYRAGSVLKVKLSSADADESEDWTFQVIEPLGFTNAREYAGYLFRPRHGTTFLIDPVFENGIHCIDSRTCDTSTEMETALAALPGIACIVRETSPRVGVRRAINTLNHLYKGKDAFAHEMRLLQANNLRNLAPLDYFAGMIFVYKDKAVDEGISYLANLLGDEQRCVIDALRFMQGGILPVQGPGGVGKTRILINLAQLHYWLMAKFGSEGDLDPLWVQSPMNKNVDDIAVKSSNACLLVYHDLREQGMNPFYPIVIRRHMGETEVHVYYGEFKRQRELKLKQSKPLYFDPDLVAEHEMEMDKQDSADDLSDSGNEGSESVESEEESEEDESEEEYEYRMQQRAVARSLIPLVKMQKAFTDQGALGFDKRLQIEDLSEGRWILRRAGFPDPGETEPHAIAKDDDTYASFRLLLKKVADSADLSPEESQEITLYANQIVKDLADRAIAICMTPDVVSQTRAHKLRPPYAVLHDEAGKTSEMGTVAGLLFSRPYETGDGPLKILPDSNKPHILFGDLFQPTPALARHAEDHPFGQQAEVSLFQRWVLNGLNTVWLWEQHRFNSNINDLVNYILPRGKMRVAPGVDERPTFALAKQCALELYGSERSTVFVRLSGKTEVLPAGKSSYNDSFVPYVLRAAYDLVKDGRFKGTQLAIMAPYTAQVASYRHVIQHLIEHLIQESVDSEKYHIGLQLKDVDVFTVDRMQGAQKDVILYDSVCSGPLKFTVDTTRQLLALGRAAALLVMFGDPKSVSDGYEGKQKVRYHKTAYYKAWYWCYVHKCFVNLENDQAKREQWQIPDFDVATLLKEYHSDKAAVDTQIRLDPDAAYGTQQKGEEVLVGFEDENAALGGFGDEVWGGPTGDGQGAVLGETTVTEPLVTEPLVTEPLVTEPLVTEPLVIGSPVTGEDSGGDGQGAVSGKTTVTEPLVTEPLVIGSPVTGEDSGGDGQGAVSGETTVTEPITGLTTENAWNTDEGGSKDTQW